MNHTKKPQRPGWGRKETQASAFSLSQYTDEKTKKATALR